MAFGRGFDSPRLHQKISPTDFLVGLIFCCGDEEGVEQEIGAKRRFPKLTPDSTRKSVRPIFRSGLFLLWRRGGSRTGNRSEAEISQAHPRLHQKISPTDFSVGLIFCYGDEEGVEQEIGAMRRFPKLTPDSTKKYKSLNLYFFS